MSLIPAGKEVDGWSWRFRKRVSRYAVDATRTAPDTRVCLVTYDFLHRGQVVGKDCIRIEEGDAVTAKQAKAAATLVASAIINMARSVTDGTFPEAASKDSAGRIGFWLREHGLLTWESLNALKNRALDQALYAGSPPFDIDAVLSGIPSRLPRHAAGR